MNTTQQQADIFRQIKETTMNHPQAPTLPVRSPPVLRKEDQQARERENRLAKNRKQSFDITMTDVEHPKAPFEPSPSQPSGFVAPHVNHNSSLVSGALPQVSSVSSALPQAPTVLSALPQVPSVSSALPPPSRK
jgi:hypothetical protein